MKNPPENRSASDELPSFLHSDDESSLVDDTTDNTSSEVRAEATAEADDAEVEAIQAEDSDRLPDDAEPGTGSGTTPRPARQKDTVSTARSGTRSLFVGGLCLLGAVTQAVLQAGGSPVADLGRFGIEPSSLFVIGTVLIAAGMNRRRLDGLQQRLETLGESGDSAAELREGLQFLVDSQHASNERPPAAGEELQHVLVALQRQDEKINNLTKAIKMYGKPLMEISGQGTELAGSLAQAKTSIEGGNETVRQAFTRLETQLRNNAAGKEIADLSDIVLKVSATLEAMQKKGSSGPSLEPLQQQVGRLEVSVAAISQRLEDNETRKSLLRLEDATQKARDEMQVLLRGEGLQKATTQLQERLDKATGRLSEGLTQMRDGHLGGLENSMREIQREVSGVATSLAQLQAAVRAGGRPVAGTPAPAPTTTTTTPSTPDATATPAKPAGETASSGSYQTGTRASSGKNVLGAIAKLKQMKN